MRNAPSPAWAKTIVREVCLAAGHKEPRLDWVVQDHPTSSRRGVTKPIVGSIEVREVDGDEAGGPKAVLLHELAHWIDAPAIRRGYMRANGSFRTTDGRDANPHDRDFYTILVPLYRKYAVPLAVACRHEYVTGLEHMANLGVAEAYAEMSVRRRATYTIHPLVVSNLACEKCGMKVSKRIAANIGKGYRYRCSGALEAA